MTVEALPLFFLSNLYIKNPRLFIPRILFALIQLTQFCLRNINLVSSIFKKIWLAHLCLHWIITKSSDIDSTFIGKGQLQVCSFHYALLRPISLSKSLLYLQYGLHLIPLHKVARVFLSFLLCSETRVQTTHFAAGVRRKCTWRKNHLFVRIHRERER